MGVLCTCSISLGIEMYFERDLRFTHRLVVDSSTVICWTSTIVTFGVLDPFCLLYSISDGKSCKQGTLYGV